MNVYTVGTSTTRFLREMIAACHRQSVIVFRKGAFGLRRLEEAFILSESYMHV